MPIFWPEPRYRFYRNRKFDVLELLFMTLNLAWRAVGAGLVYDDAMQR